MRTSTTTPTQTGFTQVNLLPPENKERQATRRRVRIVAVIGGAFIALLLVFAYFQSSKASNLESQVNAQTAQNAALQKKVNKLQPYEDKRELMIQRAQLQSTAMSGTIHWSTALHELSRILPPNLWLTSITGTSAASTVGATTGSTTAGSPVAGSMTFQCDSLDTDGVVQWLRALNRVHGWANAWVSSATKQAIGKTNVWQCASSVDLTQSALAKGGAR